MKHSEIIKPSRVSTDTPESTVHSFNSLCVGIALTNLLGAKEFKVFCNTP